MNNITPYKTQTKSKTEQVNMMFDRIANRYDFLNHFLSFGIDRRWRRSAIKLLSYERPKYILDIATGTGDFAIAATRLKPQKIVGIDLSENMIKIGRRKIKKKKLDQKIELLRGDSQKLAFKDGTFDAVTVAFGVRNFENLQKGLKEILRVLKPGGSLLVLEFSTPTDFPVKQLYKFYSNTFLPFVGRMVSRDKAAYNYLPDSIAFFPSGMKFISELNQVGFHDTFYKKLTFGIVTAYKGSKPFEEENELK